MCLETTLQSLFLLFSAMMVLRLEEIPLLTQAITHSKFQAVLSDRWEHIWFSVIAVVISNYSIGAPPDYRQ